MKILGEYAILGTLDRFEIHIGKDRIPEYGYL